MMKTSIAPTNLLSSHKHDDATITTFDKVPQVRASSVNRSSGAADVRPLRQKHPAQSVLRRTFALASLVALSSKAVSAQRADRVVNDRDVKPASPCEALNNLAVGRINGQIIEGKYFDILRDGHQFDQHCAMIQEIDSHAKNSYYKLMPPEYFADIAAQLNFNTNIHGLFMYEDGSISISTGPIDTPGKSADLYNTLRHENRHRDVYNANAEQGQQGTFLSQVNPCAGTSSQKICEREIYNVLGLLKYMSAGNTLPPKCVQKLQKAARLVKPDSLVFRVNEDELNYLKEISSRITPDQTAAANARSAIRMDLPKNAPERFPMFMMHLGEYSAKAIGNYEKEAKKLGKKDRNDLMAAEFDAVLVGNYGLEAKNAIVEATKHFREHAELRV